MYMTAANDEQLTVISVGPDGMWIESRRRPPAPPEEGEAGGADAEDEGEGAAEADDASAPAQEGGEFLPSRLLMRSANGSLFAISVGDDGALKTEAVAEEVEEAAAGVDDSGE